MTLQHLRSSTANKRPDPTAMADGQIALNTAAASPGLFYKDSAGNLVKAGPVHVGSTAPNVSPASGGTAGNSTGESWLDTSGSNPLLKIWSGAAWQTVQPVASGTVVSTADTGSVTSTMIADGTIVNADVNASAAIAGTKISPDFGSQNVTTTGTVTGASLNPTSSTVPTNGVYLPAANSVAISTNSVGRVFVDASGKVGVGTSTPSSTSGGVDISSGGIGLVVGADGNASTRTNATDKIFRIGSAHYTNAEEPVCIAFGQNLNSDNELNFGGGSAALNAATYMRFFTAANNTTTGGTERMRLDSSGRLGIGTSSPSRPLHVVGSAVFDDGTVQATIWPQIATNVAGFGTNNNYPVALVTNGSQRLHVTAAGNVGIGTTSPGTSLHCSSGSVDIATFQRSSAGSDAALMIVDSNSTGAYINTAGGANVVFATRSAGTNSERCRLDASGRLLVGTATSRSGWFNSSSWGNPTLQVEGTSVFNSGISVTNNSNDDNGSQIFLGKSRATSVGGVTVVSSGDNLGRISFQGADGSELIAAATIECNVDATPGANDMPGRLVFSTTADGASSPTERVRITNSGRLRSFGSDNVAFELATSSAAGTTNLLFSGNYGASGVGGGTESIRIFSNGNVQNTNNSYGAISDIKLKENIVDASSQWDDLKALQIRKYNFKEGQTHTQIGLVAQEVELVSPGLVSESPDRDEDGNDLGTVTKSVNYSVLYMKAVKALQEAMERIETLEAKVAALESA